MAADWNFFLSLQAGGSAWPAERNAAGRADPDFIPTILMHMTKNPLHIAIIGGGAAGFFAAVTAKDKWPEARVVIYERNRNVLAKVLVTGGGRCNLTNSFEQITDLRQAYPRGHRQLKRWFRHFDHRQTYAWFERKGVPLVTQADACVFPRSQQSASVADCLVGEARRTGVEIRTGCRLERMTQTADCAWELLFGNGETVCADRVAVTTGGAPKASLLRHLDGLGHRVEAPVPSLFTFDMADRALRSLMGTVVGEASVSIPSTKFQASGPLLITHWGMSGPAILKLSSYAARHLHECGYRSAMSVCWLPALRRSEVEEMLVRLGASHPQRQLGSQRPQALPSRLWSYLLSKGGLDEGKRWAELGRKGFNRLVELLTNDCYEITGRGTFKEEFVTCGGISLSEIDLNTMESKRCPHLFFAGEVLDIDGITGGFNLQAAWTTGYLVGQHIGCQESEG